MGGSRKLGRGDCPASSLMLLAKSCHQRDAFATLEKRSRQVIGRCRTGKSPLPKIIDTPGESALL